MANCFWVAVASILNVAMHIHGHPSQQMMQPQTQMFPQQTQQQTQQQTPLIATEPSQNQCPQLKTLKYNPNSNMDQIQNWSVVKVTRMSQTTGAGQNAFEDAQLQQKLCSLFSDISNCLGVSYSVTNRHSNGFAAHTFAYDGQTQNLQPQERSFNLVDGNFEIYSVQKNNAQNAVTGMSQGATMPQELMFGAIAENSNGFWKMYALCDQSMAWVVAPADELRNNPQYLENYRAEIEGALQQIKSSMASMSQGTGAMNTNMSPAPTSVHNPLPIVSIFGSPSSSMSPPTATSPAQSSVQNAYGSSPAVSQAPPTSPPSAVAYASVGTPTTPAPAPAPAPLPPAPPMLFGGGASPVSPPPGVVIA